MHSRLPPCCSHRPHHRTAAPRLPPPSPGLKACTGQGPSLPGPEPVQLPRGLGGLGTRSPGQGQQGATSRRDEVLWPGRCTCLLSLRGSSGLGLWVLVGRGRELGFTRMRGGRHEQSQKKICPQMTGTCSSSKNPPPMSSVVLSPVPPRALSSRPPGSHSPGPGSLLLVSHLLPGSCAGAGATPNCGTSGGVPWGWPAPPPPRPGRCAADGDGAGAPMGPSGTRCHLCRTHHLRSPSPRGGRVCAVTLWKSPRGSSSFQNLLKVLAHPEAPDKEPASVLAWAPVRPPGL